MKHKNTHTYEIKSLIVNEDGKKWGIVFYDSTKNKSVEKELKRMLRKASEK